MPTPANSTDAGSPASQLVIAPLAEGDLPEAERIFRLSAVTACEALAVDVGMPNLLAGANLARQEAYKHLVARAFRTEIQGVNMHRRNDPGYCRAGVYIIDDWR